MWKIVVEQFLGFLGLRKIGNTQKEQVLKDLEEEGILSGAENIDDFDKMDVQVLDENTPDYYGSWDSNDFAEYHRRVQEIDQAQAKGEAQLKTALQKYGCTSFDEFDRIRDTFLKNHSQDERFIQAMMNIGTAQMRQEMKSSLDPKLLEPIEGVSLELYATIMAKRTQIKDPAESHRLLAQHGLDDAKFNKADQGWQARMRQVDVMEDGGLMMEYGKYFAAAGQGQFGAGAQAAADGIGIDGVPGQAPAGDEPCTFEKFCEIGAAQNVWANQGQDVNAMLKQVFGMDAIAWSNMGAYWSQRIAADYTLAVKMTDIQNKYEEKYRAGSSAPDDDINF